MKFLAATALSVCDPDRSLQNVDENGFDAGFTRYFTNTLGVTAEVAAISAMHMSEISAPA